MRSILALDVGPQEIIVVLLLALLLFGAKRLPEIGKGLGKGIREFRDATKGLADDVKSGLEGDGKSAPDAKTSQTTPPPARQDDGNNSPGS
ncbi:MAG: twin-arginine translocase TatA/TatE family subunit [Actinomycetota bacterium]